MPSPRRSELLNRRRLDVNADLAALDAGELWHPLSEAEWITRLHGTLDDIDAELAEEEMGEAEFE